MKQRARRACADALACVLHRVEGLTQACDRAFERASDRDLDRDLDRIIDLDNARALGHILDSAHANLDSAHSFGHDRVNDPVSDRDLDLIRALDRVLDVTRALDCALSRAYDLTRARVLDLADALARVQHRVEDHDRELMFDRALALDHAHKCALSLIKTLEYARDLHLAERRTTLRGAKAAMPSWLSRRLVALATLMLPAQERSRYREEFGVELVELSRHERLMYGLRVLAHSRELRGALIDAARTPDHSPARRAER